MWRHRSLSNRKIQLPARVMKAFTKVLLLGLGGLLSGFLLAQSSPGLNDRHKQPAAKPKSTSSGARADAPRTDTRRPPAATVGHLETRNHTVTVTIGPKGPCYTVRSKDGRLLHKNLTASELQAKAPALYQLVNGAYAGQPTKGAVRLDASLRVQQALPNER
jgi:hypothetical protein